MANELRIRLTRGKAGKPDTLTCTRPDGSTTWGRCPGPGLHDLLHFVVETELALENSFYALVGRGYDISDFAVQGAAKALDLPQEAGQTEFVVGLLQTEIASGVPFDDFVAEVRNACVVANTPPPDFFSSQDVPRIRAAAKALLARWSNTGPGEYLEFRFPMLPLGVTRH